MLLFFHLRLSKLHTASPFSGKHICDANTWCRISWFPGLSLWNREGWCIQHLHGGAIQINITHVKTAATGLFLEVHSRWLLAPTQFTHEVKLQEMLKKRYHLKYYSYSKESLPVNDKSCCHGNIVWWNVCKATMPRLYLYMHNVGIKWIVYILCMLITS